MAIFSNLSVRLKLYHVYNKRNSGVIGGTFQSRRRTHRFKDGENAVTKSSF
jgi:hypothetical protein